MSTRVCSCCGAAQPLGAAPAEVSGRGLRQILEQAPIPVLVGFLEPGSEPSRRVQVAMHGWASVYAGKLLVLRLDLRCYPRTSSALEVCVSPTVQLWNRQRRLLSVEGASDLAAVNTVLGALVDRAARPSRSGPREAREHSLTV